MLQIWKRLVILALSFGYLYISTRIVLSMVYTRESPQESLDKYWLFFFPSFYYLPYYFYLLPSYYCSSIESAACKYSPLISNSLSKFQNLFSINLYSSLSLNTQVNDLTMAYIILQQFSSMAFCSSTSSPLTPFLLATANKYFNPPSFTMPFTTSCQSSLPNPINPFATHFSAMPEYSFFIFKKEIMRQLPFIQVQVLWFWGRVKFMRRSERQEKRLLRNYFQSQLVGRRVQQEEMVQSRIQMPEKWEKRCWDFQELDSRAIRMSELAYLLSSMILCLTMKLGMILLARYSNNCLSSANMSPTLSVTFINTSTSLKHFNPASYSSILSYQSNLTNSPTTASTHELSTIHTTHRQQIQKSWSSWGQSQRRSQRIQTIQRERSMLGWVRSLMKQGDMCEEMMSGRCQGVRDYERDQMMLWRDYQEAQKRYGWSGYFMRRFVFCQRFQRSYFDCWVRDQSVMESYFFSCCCWGYYSEYYQRFIGFVVSFKGCYWFFSKDSFELLLILIIIMCKRFGFYNRSSIKCKKQKIST